MTLLLGLLASMSGCGSAETIVIGSKNFTEQVILGDPEPFRSFASNENGKGIVESQGLQPLHTLFSITLLDPLVNFPGITDRIILQVRTISDIAPYTPSWLAAFGYEFIERADGFEGLSETYDLKFAEPPRVMELGLTYRALAEQRVDILDFR